MDAADRRPFWLSPTWAFAALSLAIASLGFALYYVEKAVLTRSAINELQVVNTTKKALIEHWFDERVDDFKQTLADAQFTHDLAAWRRTGRRDDAYREQLLNDLWRASKTVHYLEVSLRSAEDGALLLSTTGDADDAHVRTLALAASRSAEPSLEDFHTDPERGADNYLGLFAAVIDPDSGRPQEVMHVAIDPSHILFPLVQQRHGSATSAEALLGRLDGDALHVLDMSIASFSPDLRLGSIGAALARGDRGSMVGEDSAGTAVISYAQEVRGAPWILITKMDEGEAYGTLNLVTAASAAVAGMLLLVSVWWWSQHQRQAAAASRHLVERSLLTKRIDFLARFANDCIVLCDADGRITDINDRCLATYGHGRPDMLSMNFAELCAPCSRGELATALERLKSEGSLIFEIEHCRNDSSTFAVEISARLIDVEGKRRIQAIVRDISERRIAERRILGLSRLHATTAAVNQAIVRTTTQGEALERVCRACVEHGRFRMAWVGLESADSCALEIVATAGEGTAYLDAERLRNDAVAVDPVEPTTIAYRTQCVHVCNDLLTGRSGRATRRAAQRHGFAAAIALPLRRGDITVGALTVYSAEADALDDRAVGLLREMAENLSFAIEHFAHEEQRQHAEAALRHSESRLQHAQAIGQFGDWEYDRATRQVTVSRELSRILRRPALPGTLHTAAFWSWCPQSGVEQVKRAFRHAVRNAARVEIELRIEHENDPVSFQDVTIVPSFDSRGRVSKLHGTVQDVSARRRLEIEHVEHVRRLAELSRRVVSAQEDERRRISSELHDRTGANLAAISLNLAVIGRNVEASTPDGAALFEETRGLLTDTILSIRDICTDLRPAILDMLGICAALEMNVQRFSRRTGIATELELDPVEGRCGADVESMLFRIAQEALTNCAKHSQAKTVRLRLARENGHVMLSIADDGIGFDAKALARGGSAPGLGLLNMRERAEFAGARFSVVSACGRGTRIDVACAVVAPRRHLSLARRASSG
jgi:PAS domain S-box-containing protein